MSETLRAFGPNQGLVEHIARPNFLSALVMMVIDGSSV